MQVRVLIVCSQRPVRELQPTRSSRLSLHNVRPVCEGLIKQSFEAGDRHVAGDAVAEGEQEPAFGRTAQSNGRGLSPRQNCARRRRPASSRAATRPPAAWACLLHAGFFRRARQESVLQGGAGLGFLIWPARQANAVPETFFLPRPRLSDVSKSVPIAWGGSAALQPAE